MSHEILVVKVGKPQPLLGADRLEVLRVGGWTLVVGKGDFQEGDLAVHSVRQGKGREAQRKTQVQGETE